MMKTNVKEIKRKHPFSEKYSRDQTVGKKTKKTSAAGPHVSPREKLHSFRQDSVRCKYWLEEGRESLCYFIWQKELCDPPQ